jgi:SOS response regulatory protein OraA/RecX
MTFSYAMGRALPAFCQKSPCKISADKGVAALAARYLSKAELEEVHKRPRNSKEQVDLVIRFMDKHNAVDDALRQQGLSALRTRGRNTSASIAGSPASGS